jgi:hypothetical protein
MNLLIVDDEPAARAELGASLTLGKPRSAAGGLLRTRLSRTLPPRGGGDRVEAPQERSYAS